MRDFRPCSKGVGRIASLYQYQGEAWKERCSRDTAREMRCCYAGLKCNGGCSGGVVVQPGQNAGLLPLVD